MMMREEKKEKKKKGENECRTLKYWDTEASGRAPVFGDSSPRIPRADPESRGPGKTVSGGDMGMCCCTAADAAEEGRRWPKANSHLLAGQGEPFDPRSPNLAAGVTRTPYQGVAAGLREGGRCPQAGGGSTLAWGATVSKARSSQ